MFETLDKRFNDLVKASARVEKLYQGCRWAEGPAYLPAGRYLVWSDIPNDRMLRWDETTGAVGVFRHPAGYTNGNTVDRAGRLVTCEHGGRRVTRTEHDGAHHRPRRPLRGQAAQQPERRGRQIGRLDLVHRPGLRHRFRLRGPQGRERDRRLPRLPRRSVNRASAASSPTTSCARTALPSRPTRRRLYVSDTGASHVPDGPRHIRGFDVGERRHARPAATCSRPAPPACSTASASTTPAGIWTSAGDGVHCYDPDGTLIGKVLVPETRRQRRVRRPEAQPPLHLRDHLALRRDAAGERREDVLTESVQRYEARNAARFRITTPTETQDKPRARSPVLTACRDPHRSIRARLSGSG